MSEQNKALTREIFEGVVTHGQMDRMREIVAEDSFDHGAALLGWKHGYRDHVVWFRGMFPDVVAQVTDMVAEDDRVVAYWTFTGTHEGEFMGFRAPGGRCLATV